MEGTMKAALFEDINKISVKEVPIPKVGPRDALIRVKACAICGSDLKIFHNGHKLITFPAITGHEFAGEVVEVGPEAKVFKVGDRVSVGCDVSCGICRNCKNGSATHCATPHAFGHDIGGGFAEYCLLPSYSIEGGPVHHLPDHVSYEEGALAEPLACIINGLENTKIKLGDTVVIIGAGAIGCLMIQLVKNLGAKKVILIQRSKKRLEMAKQMFNADVYISSQEEDVIARVLEETDGMGADVVITTNQSPETHVQALDMCRVRGTICLFGGMVKGTYPKDFDTNKIHYKELFVVGAHGSNSRQHQLAVDLIASGVVKVKDVISEKFELDQIEEAFACTESHKGFRNFIIP